MRYLLFSLLFISAFALAQDSEIEPEEAPRRTNQPQSSADEQARTNIDFDATLIEGKMKAPSGFFLQGRGRQSLSNLVKLRSNFKQELRNSRSAVKAMVR